MVHQMTVIGIRGDAPFEKMIEHFISLGGESVILDPMQVYGKDMLISAVQHAERAFKDGTNSSKSLLTEIILYASGERQISKALTKMKPKEGCNEYAVIILDVEGELLLDELGMMRDDSIVEGNDEKAYVMGLVNENNIPYDGLALERVAMVDILKKLK